MNKIKYLHYSNLRRQLLVSGVAIPALAWAGATHAQRSAKIRRIGLLSAFSSSDRFEAFRQGLRELGWVEGKNIVIEYRYAEGSIQRLRELAAEFVDLKVDIIVAPHSSGARAARRATTTIPVVMTFIGDPVDVGLVKSLPRPGGNITGLAQISSALAGKRLELLKEMIPKLSRVALLWCPPLWSGLWKELQLSSRRLGLQLYSMEVRNTNDFEKAFDDAVRARAGALFISPALLIYVNLKRIAGLAIKNRLPSIYDFSHYAENGGLLTYGTNSELDQRAAVFVDKIFKGAKPADLPIEQPTKFDLVINLKTAKLLGITVPQSILVRAERVIE
jgi:putative tryptophan/tyrosine transport system substrate-binding protein